MPLLRVNIGVERWTGERREHFLLIEDGAIINVLPSTEEDPSQELELGLLMPGLVAVPMQRKDVHKLIRELRERVDHADTEKDGDANEEATTGTTTEELAASPASTI